MRQILLTLIVCCLAGCVQYTHHNPISNAQVVPVYITGFIPDVRRELVGAVGEWNVALNGHMVLVVMSEEITSATMPLNFIAQKQNAIVIVGVDREAPMIQAAHFDGAVAVSYPWGHKKPASIIYLTNTLSPKTARHILLHEIGHSEGAEHLDYSLMQLHYSIDYDCIDEKTMMQVAKANRWDLWTTNWCE